MSEKFRRRRVGIMLHPSRLEAIDVACAFVEGMGRADIDCYGFGSEQIEQLNQRLDGDVVEAVEADSIEDVELLVVFGGDGTILRAAELCVPSHIPLLGVNLGHVGFLAELDSYDVDRLVTYVIERDYTVEERLTLDVELTDEDGNLLWSSMAVNEVSVEKAAREKMLDMLIEVDHHPLSRWGCDGMLIATPTGSTAYAFSLGGPVIWPDVQAFLLCPMAAHALFARPVVLDPRSKVHMRLSDEMSPQAIVWCDGRRYCEISSSTHIHIRRGKMPLRVARLQQSPFTSRLVKKFNLNIEGFRGAGMSDA